MERLLKPNEREHLQDTFKTHPLLSTCYKVFTPRMARLDKGFLVTPVDVFSESARLLDFLLEQPDISQHQVDSLWDLLYIDIMKWGTNVTDHNKQMVAGTVFQVVRATLTQYYDSRYSDIVCDLLNHTLEREQKECDEKEQAKFFQQLMDQSPELCEWINSYDEADEWLSDQITGALEVKSGTAAKKKGTTQKKVERKPSTKPKTLKYFKGNKGVLRKQGERLKLVFEKWNMWGWIDSKTTTGDFDAFFEGESRHCNITWKASTTVLTILLQALLKQTFIAKQKGQSASSMVKEQFGMTPNFDQKRLADDDKFRINASVYLLDINNPIPLRKGGDDNDYDISDAAFQEVFSGQLRSTKGI